MSWFNQSRVSGANVLQTYLLPDVEAACSALGCSSPHMPALRLRARQNQAVHSAPLEPLRLRALLTQHVACPSMPDTVQHLMWSALLLHDGCMPKPHCIQGGTVGDRRQQGIGWSLAPRHGSTPVYLPAVL